jgi:sugar phosphate permease
MAVIVTAIFGVALGAGAAGNQTALYRQAPAEALGTASGLLRTFGYLGSIAASAITGIVFHASVSDDGLHHIAYIMVGVSVVLVVMTIVDRTLRTRPPEGAPPLEHR